MKNIYSFVILATIFFGFSLTGVAQVLNQSAAWPNPNWTVTGSYDTDPSAFEADPTITANFAFDDDDAGSGSDDSIAAESPIIDLTPAHTAGETWLKITVDYGYRYLSNDVLEFQYYDNDAGMWVSWENASLPGNNTSITDNFCTIPKTTYTTDILDIGSFTPTQLSGFRYRIFYDDDPSGSDWNYGFCFDSPSIVSEAPPTCLAPTTLTASGITTTAADLGWTDPNSATSWDVHIVPAGDPAPNATTSPSDPGVANPFNKTGLTPNTAYEFYVRADCGGGDLSAWAGPFAFATLCDVVSTFPWTEDFESVSTPDLPNCWSAIDNNADGDEWKTYGSYGVGGTTAVGIYTDFNSGNNDDYLVLPQFALTGNQRLKFSVRARSSSEPNDYEVLLSTTGDAPADFTTQLMPVTTVSSTTHSEITPIDLSAYTGNVYIAIHIPNGGLDGWYIYFDDFVVEEIPTCLAPTTLTASGITTTAADLGWTDPNSAPSWDVHIVPAGDPAPDATTSPSDPGVSNPFNKTGLNHSTFYEFYVRADCGGGDLSTWAGPFAFATLCDVVSTFPWTEDFESVSTPDLPSCWSAIDNNADGDEWKIYGTYGVGGSTAVGIYTDFNSGNNDDYLVLPQFALTGNQRLKFSVRARSSSEPNDYEVLLSTTGDAPADFTTQLMPVTTVSSTTHSEITPIDLSAYTGNVYIAIHIPNGGLDGYYIYFDDFVVEDIPSCIEPTALATSNVNPTTVDLGWTESGSATLWDVHVVPAGDPAPTASTTPSDPGVSNPFSKTGLASNTAYEFYVRADCGGGDLSTWAGPFAFSTPCSSTTVPYTLDFESITPPDLPNCSVLETLSGSDWETANVSESGFSSNVLRYSWHSSQNADTWFYIQGLDLTGGTTYELSFGYGNNSTSYTESLKVSYGTSPSSTDMVNLLADYPTINSNSRSDVSIAFTPATTDTYYIGFNSYSVANQYRLYVDDISVIALATCPEPTNLVASAITTTTADLGWTENGGATTWNIEYGPTGFAQGSGTLISASTNPHPLSGLTAGTAYDFYVQADCGGGDLSIWSAVGTFNTQSDCPGVPLAITSSTPGTTNCGGTVTLTATASGSGSEIYWYDAPAGGNLVGIGSTFTSPVLDMNTTYYATEVLIGSGSGGSFPTYCAPSVLSTGCSSGDNIEDFTLLDSTGNKLIEHLATGCSSNNYGDFTSDPNLTANLMAGETYDFTVSHQYQFGNEYVSIFIDLDANGSFADPGEELFVSSTGNSGTTPTSGSITIPTSAVGGEVAMRVVTIYGNPPSGACTTGGTYGETHDYKVIIQSVICESFPRTPVVATVNNGDKQVAMTSSPGVYTDTDDTANFGDTYSGAPGNNCGTTSNYLGGNEVVYYYTASDSYSLNIAMSGLSAGESGVFVYDSCLDIGTNCIEGMTSSTATDYDFDMIVQSGEDYFIVVSSSAATGTLGYTLTLTETASPCLNLDIVSSTGGTVPCIGKTVLTATGSGIGNEIYWYNAPTGGDLVGIGSSFQTPQISATTSYWATEVITAAGGGGGALPTYCTPTFTSGCSGFGDDIDSFVLTDPSGSTIISHLGTGCSSNDYGDYTNDPSLTGVLIPGNTYDFDITHNESNHYVKIWLDIDKNGSFEDAGELLFTSTTGVNNTTGSITIPPTANGTTVLRIITKYGSVSTNSCTTGGTWGETHDYKVILPNVVCESPREEVVATVDTAGNITVTTPLPYSDTNDTANFGNPYEGNPGGDALCGTTENYLNGNDVVYYFTAQNTELVDIEMSNLSDFYGAVFVFDSCGDIYTDCLAGAVAGPSDNDFKIDDFQVTAGEDYYIVVSSWLSSSIGYTLDIIPFDCANLPAPDGEAAQDFVSGDTVSSLEVEPTENGATLTWYESASDIPGNPITGDPALVDGEDYYVTQTFNGCESPALVVSVDEIDCSMLAITSTTGDNTSCKGVLTLTAVGSGTPNTEIYWYNAATGGDLVGIGPTFTTPELTSTTSYWAAEVYTDLGGGSGTLPSNYCVPVFTSGCSGFGDDVNDFILKDSGGNTVINHLGSGCSPNDYGDFTTDSSLTGNLVTGGTYTVNITSNYASEFFSVWVDYDRNGSFAEPGELVFSSTTATPVTGTFTIPSNLVSGATVLRVKAGDFGAPTDPCAQDSFGETHDYKVMLIGQAVICESSRVEVNAVVNQTGDITLDYNDISYTDTSNTSNFNDKFAGNPGAGCGGDGILNGADVVYHYTADPNNDDILDIELSGISHPNTGMFIYASCGEVGINCLAGGLNENGLGILIDDYYVAAGTEFFIVISSATGSTNYTLNIDRMDCANIPAPTSSGGTLYFVSGDVLSDIESTITTNQYGTLTWYADLADIPGNPLDPTTEMIVDGTTYYVTQTILGCESAPLAITPEEFQCEDMKIETITPNFTICAPGGQVTLDAQGTGIGSNLYWFDAQTGGNVISIGNTLTTTVSNTTTYWVSEVFLETSSVPGGSLQSYCVPTFSSGCSGFGDDINDFILSGLGGTTIINHIGSGCSPNDYGDFTTDPNLVGTLVSGSTYNVDITSNYASEFFSVWIDLNQNGSFSDAGEHVYSSATATPASGTITIPSGTLAGSTVLRVKAGDFDAPTDACAPDSFGETHDYKINIIGQSVVCESTRSPVTVTVNNQPTDAPTGTANQKLCQGNTLADIVVAGTDIQWYSSPTGGSPLGMGTIVQDGDVFYATQTLNACESDTRLEVMVFVLPNATAPQGAANQTFLAGQTIADLTVTGTDLIWYEDEDMTQIITDPANFLLENYETYYVSQSPAGHCESEVLAITVHEELGTRDPIFAELTYHPNPMLHTLTISNNGPIEYVAIYDLLGRKVMERKVGNNQLSMDVSNLQSGTYFLWVNINGKTGVFKLLKE